MKNERNQAEPANVKHSLLSNRTKLILTFAPCVEYCL